MRPPAWQMAKDAVRFHRERGISFRAYSQFRDARLQLLPANMDVTAGLVVDVGANRGDWTATICRIFPSVSVLAIEPNPPTHAALSARCKELPNVTVVASAVGAAEGTAEFHAFDHDVFGSLLEPTAELPALFGAGARATRSLRVPVTTLDTLVGSRHVSLLKIDVQGFELEVIEGGKRTLTSTDAVLVEANFAAQYKGGARFSQVDEALFERGFELWDMSKAFRGEVDRALWADALYLRRGIDLAPLG